MGKVFLLIVLYSYGQIFPDTIILQELIKQKNNLLTTG
jgi:hypothetical protein